MDGKMTHKDDRVTLYLGGGGWGLENPGPHIRSPRGARWCSECRRMGVWTQVFQKYINTWVLGKIKTYKFNNQL